MKNDTPITITLTRIDLCNLALACTNAWAQSNANKWLILHDTIIAEIVAADEADQEAPQEAPAAEAEQQPTETENAAQEAARQAEDITAAIIGAIGAPAPAHTITVTWTNGTRATYSANMLDMIRTDPAALDIQDDDTGELVYIRP